MKRILFIMCIGILAFSCMSDHDIPPNNYDDFVILHGLSSSVLSSSSLSSSSVVGSSSSGMEASSSSVEVSSSSSGVGESSSSVVGSSSSVISSSSSALPSSSSSMPSSSSSAELSSSGSVASSSSSSFVGDFCNITEFDTNNFTCGSQTYGTVKIGDQVWMAENLNYNVDGSKCYDGDNNNCNTYGRLYNWAMAMNLPPNCNAEDCSSQMKDPHQGICPEGWHIPRNNKWTDANDEWGTLITSAENINSDIAMVLKVTEYWGDGNNGTNSLGFSALPAGHYDKGFSGLGNASFWWSLGDSNDSNIMGVDKRFHETNYLEEGTNRPKTDMISVRCIKDNP